MMDVTDLKSAVQAETTARKVVAGLEQQLQEIETKQGEADLEFARAESDFRQLNSASVLGEAKKSDVDMARQTRDAARDHVLALEDAASVLTGRLATAQEAVSQRQKEAIQAAAPIARELADPLLEKVRSL